MPGQSADVDLLRCTITDEIAKVMGLRLDSWQRKLLGGISSLPAGRFAKLAAGFDHQVALNGITTAAQWMLLRIATCVTVEGAEEIPANGPLLVASNHPGAFDGIAIIAGLGRDDLKLIVSDVPFTRGLPNLEEHLIFSSGDNPPERMAALRASIRHLETGGALLVFPTGLVDPDPAFMPGAGEALEGWSPSLELMLRKVPQTRLLITIASGVLAPKFLDNPIVRRKKTVRARQKLAEYFEIIQIMVVQKELGLSPRLSFALPLTSEELRQDSSTMMPAILKHARQTLADHIAWSGYSQGKLSK
jgi:hypothetical protein